MCIRDRERPELRFPADMYMEGGDQFRGWFQSSLLTSVDGGIGDVVEMCIRDSRTPAQER